MLHLPSESATVPSPAEIEAARRAALCDSERADAITYDWTRIGFGIVLSGGVYPIVLCGIAAIVGFLVIVRNLLSGDSTGSLPEQVLSGSVILFMYAIGGSLVGFMWAGFVTALTLPLIYSIAWSLHLRTNIVWLGAFSGGLIGFICVLPLTLSLPSLRVGGGIYGIPVAVLLGPGLTTILGQIGGAWGGMKSREIGVALDWRRYLVLPPDAQKITASAISELNRKQALSAQPQFQFSIRQLLWVAVWLSLLLSLIRLCGIPFDLMLPLLLGWLLFQLTTLWLGRWLFRRFGPWWRARRLARST